MRSALLVAVLGASAAAAAAAGAGGGTGLVRISGASPIARSCEAATAQRGTEVEPTLAADPRRPRRLVAAWQQDRYRRGGGAGAIGAADSRDGGATWRRPRVPGISDCRGPSGRNSDPWVSIGPDGTAYLASLPARVTSRTGLTTAVAVSVSRDGGASWLSPAVVAGSDGGRFNDKETVTADPTRPGHAYLVWSQLDRIRFTRTVDAGRTWSPPRTIARGRQVNIAAISVLADGTLLHAFARAGARSDALLVARSRDAGA